MILLDFSSINIFDFFWFSFDFSGFQAFLHPFHSKIPCSDSRSIGALWCFLLNLLFSVKKEAIRFLRNSFFQFQFSLCQHAVRSCPLAEHLPHPAVNVHLIDRLQLFRRHHVANLPLRRALSAVHQHSVRAVLSGEAQIMHLSLIHIWRCRRRRECRSRWSPYH